MTDDPLSWKDSDDSQLADYFAGELSTAERERMERWISAEPARREMVARLRRKWERVETESVGEVDVQEAWKAVAVGIRSDGAAKSSGRIRGVAWYVVGAVALALVFLMVGRWSEGRRVSTTLSARTSTYATANGERATITLPDGSLVSLNVASRLQVPADYAAGDRTVRLTGEALFTVAHQRGAAFTVLAGPSTTRVLGTSFLVRHYASDTAATVAVRDGRVAVQSLVLAASQLVTVGARGVGQVQRVDPGRFTFTSGVLTLNGVMLRDAIPDLDRWYDADIRLGDSALGTERIVGGFTAGSLADLVAILELTFGHVRVVRDGRVVTLYSRA